VVADKLAKWAVFVTISWKSAHQFEECCDARTPISIKSGDEAPKSWYMQLRKAAQIRGAPNQNEKDISQ